MSQNAAMMMAQIKNLDDLRVFMALVAKLDFENLLVLNQANLSRELGMHRQHVQRSIKRLIALGALIEGPRIGISRSYRFNPNFGWKGSAKNHVVALDHEIKRRMNAANISSVINGGEEKEKIP